MTPEFVVPVPLSEGPKPTIINLPLQADDPIVAELLELQRREPVTLLQLVNGTRTASWRAYETFVFQDHVVVATGIIPGRTDPVYCEEVLLRVKRYVLQRGRQVRKLRQEVEALERIADPARIRRELIPTAVKLTVYERDKGVCCHCSAATDLQFDHIIPVAKGGSNSESNIQILCGRCNREKSANIV
ncbi:hypothetical protein BH23GEM2_BH23GEM2_14840 [soil metagenome]